MAEQRHILVGVIGAPQGVRGEVRIRSYTGVPTAIGRYGALAGEGGRGPFEIVSLRPQRDDMVVAKLKGVEDRDAAGGLTGVRLYAPRDRLPAIGDDEIYQADLIGLLAVTTDANAIGRVVGVENYGGGDLLDIDQGSGNTILVPFNRDFVPDIDLAAGRLTVAGGALDESDVDTDGSAT